MENMRDLPSSTTIQSKAAKQMGSGKMRGDDQLSSLVRWIILKRTTRHLGQHRVKGKDKSKARTSDNFEFVGLVPALDPEIGLDSFPITKYCSGPFKGAV